MVDLPAANEGLDWISRHEPAKLPLIPGVQAAAITAAACGHLEALTFLRMTAQQHAAFARPLNPDPADSIYLAVTSKPSPSEFKTEVAFVTAQKQHRLHLNPKLQQLVKDRAAHGDELFEAAARAGLLDALQWLYALCHIAQPSLNKAMVRAACGGHLSTMQWLHAEPRSVVVKRNLQIDAARHPDCVRWVLTKVPECLSITASQLAQAGDLGTLTWIRDNLDFDFSMDSFRTMAAAAAGGNLNVIKWLRSLDTPCPWDSRCTGMAAKKGDIAMLQWMRAQQPPCPWDATSPAKAASSGHLNVIKWLRQQHPPCPWDASCATAAARRGSLEILQWITNQDPACPMDESTFMAACALPTTDTAQWLKDNGCAIDAHTAYNSAVQCNSKAVLQWLHTSSIWPVTPLPLVAVRSDPEYFWRNVSTPMLMFLGDIKCPMRKFYRQALLRARKRYCAFHGLLRWCSRAFADPSRGAHRAFDCFAADGSGQQLLARISMLPPELINKIAVMAGLQHDMEVTPMQLRPVLPDLNTVDNSPLALQD